MLVPLSVVGAGGGASPNPPGKELGYAQITTQFVAANTPAAVQINALSVTCTPPSGGKYVVEFFCAGLDENTGVTAGELVTATLSKDSVFALTTGNVIQGVGGFGSSLYLKSPTQTGDGSAHEFELTVQNINHATDGVLVEADGDFPAYVRVVST